MGTDTPDGYDTPVGTDLLEIIGIVAKGIIKLNGHYKLILYRTVAKFDVPMAVLRWSRISHLTAEDRVGLTTSSRLGYE
jgi:hypothetical protein